MNSNLKSKRKLLIILASIATVISLLLIAAAIYLCDFYRADTEAIEAYLGGKTTASEDESGNIIFMPEGASDGVIFYPGGKVEYTAYIPLMAALSERGIASALIEMPFNLAVFDINAADGVREAYPEIESWYIGGHSLGGSMAASYLGKNKDSFEGLILLGSYSTEDLSDTDLGVLSIYGSEDLVMNREKYESNKQNLPEGFTERVIEGGCHAYFGMYGAQEGDGNPTVSNAEQINITADFILEFVK